MMSDDELRATVERRRNHDWATNRLYEEFDGEDAEARAMADALAGVLAERDKLQRFKDYVHKRLDEAGVPVDPESQHKAEGCRIGGRLDHVLSRLWGHPAPVPANEELAAKFRAAQRATADGSPEGTAEALERSAKMLETYGPDVFPANEKGQIHFGRAMMESAADEIRAFLAATALKTDDAVPWSNAPPSLIDTVADQITLSWDRWSDEAGWQAQAEQSSETWLFAMRTRLRDTFGQFAAKVADDAEPVCGDWWQSVEFRHVDLAWQGYGPDSAYVMSPDEGFGIRQRDGVWGAYHLTADGFDGSEDWLCPVPTKGHARRLFAALGQPLKEGGGK